MLINPGTLSCDQRAHQWAHQRAHRPWNASCSDGLQIVKIIITIIEVEVSMSTSSTERIQAVVKKDASWVMGALKDRKSVV